MQNIKCKEFCETTGTKNKYLDQDFGNQCLPQAKNVFTTRFVSKNQFWRAEFD